MHLAASKPLAARPTPTDPPEYEQFAARTTPSDPRDSNTTASNPTTPEPHGAIPAASKPPVATPPASKPDAFTPTGANPAAPKAPGARLGGLGRGLDALIPRRPQTDGDTRTIPLDRLRPNSAQPRRAFDETALAELAESIRTHGLLQPILARPRGDGFEIVAGERRWRAAKLAGLSEAPVTVRVLDDRQTIEAAVIENLQREDLTPLEEARAYQQLAAFGLNQDAVAKAVGKGRSTVANALRLLTLSAGAQAALDDGRLTPGHARAILALPKARQEAALERIVKHHLSVRQAEALRDDAHWTPPAKVERPYRELELSLTRRLGAKARITGRERGKLELSYGSPEELDRLLDLLGLED